MPTARGFQVAGAGLALCVLGVLLGYRGVALLGALAVLAVAGASLFVLWGRPSRAAVRRTVPVRRVGAGGAVTVRLSVEGAGRLGPVVLRERVAATGEERRITLAPASSSGSGRPGAAYRLEPSRRGVVELGPVRVERTDVLGLAAAGAEHGPADRVCVHPRWRRLRTLPAGRASAPDSTLGSGRAGTLTFRTLRDYAPGDDIRHIHWRSTARTGRLLTRVYADTSDARLTVLLDDRAVGGRERLDATAEAAACVAATAVLSRMPCALVLASGPIVDDRAGLPAMLDLLAAADPVPGADLAAALRDLRVRAGGGTVVLVSDALGESDLRVFAELRGRGSELVAAAVGPDPRPGEVPGVALVAATGAAEFGDAWDEAPWRR
ncbi:DUF58 domain-containing protein [Actinorugispora endophytica]|uniref:Uncharacterized protein (DUF58 family) n=1 Tax=Actinorugispora endophytica TaxID=1605990 RepID=A0A4R6V484_9ACTN|nr:DUF58 domain-containing protein [Actinorugispora endophytica]TDQ54993.1 uncharacterized protein (DUF58 family) [Actinorugispora endophytica]